MVFADLTVLDCQHVAASLLYFLQTTVIRILSRKLETMVRSENHIKEAFFISSSVTGVFWVYTAVSAVGLLFCILFVPETRHRSLEEIESHFRECEGWSALFTTIKPLENQVNGNVDTDVADSENHL